MTAELGDAEPNRTNQERRAHDQGSPLGHPQRAARDWEHCGSTSDPDGILAPRPDIVSPVTTKVEGRLRTCFVVPEFRGTLYTYVTVAEPITTGELTYSNPYETHSSFLIGTLTHGLRTMWTSSSSRRMAR